MQVIFHAYPRIAPATELDPIWEWPTQTLTLSGKILRRLAGVDPMFNRSRTMARLKARTLMYRLCKTPVDAIFAPVGSRLTRLAADPGRIETMRIAASDDFESQLNWHSWSWAALAQPGQAMVS